MSARRGSPVLNRLMTLEARALTPDGGGGQSEAWQALGTIWAKLERPAARLVREGAMEISMLRVRILVRAAPVGQVRRPKVGQRLVMGTRSFTILGVTEHDPRALYLQIWAEEGAM